MTSGRGKAIVAVLDNEPIQALADPAHPKHRDVFPMLEAVVQRRRRGAAALIVVPTVVRLEAEVDRRAPPSALLGQLRVRDEPLTGSRADRAVALRRAAGGSPADAATAQLAEEFAASAAVTIYTSDLTDLPRLIDAMSPAADVQLRRV